MSDVSIEEIESVLDEERAALLAGDLGGLGEIAARKQALAEALSHGVPEAAELKRLSRKAERNAELLAAAMRGLRKITRRVAEIRQANGPLKTYGRDGTQQMLGATAGTFERRA